jgi:hypothetical protein
MTGAAFASVVRIQEAVMFFKSYLNGFALLVVGCGLSACMKIRTVDADEPAGDVHEISEAKAGAQVTGAPYVEVLPAPNAYQVLIPVNQEFGEVVIQRTGPDKVKQQLVLASSHFGAIDEKVKSGETYLYEWNGQKTELTIPVDFEVKGEMSFGQKETEVLFKPGANWGRIWFHENAILTTLGQDLELKANELIFVKATLRSFRVGQQAGVGVDGRSGGRLRLKALKASGVLNLELRGEKGGVGLPGADQFSRTSPFGQLCGDGICLDQHQCVSGGPVQGGQGGIGKNGGSTPITNIDIADTRDLNLQILSEPGYGGQGGAGGRSGLAPPTTFGDRRIYLGCMPGAVGPEGFPGSSGVQHPVCRRQGAEMVCVR